MKSSYAVDGRKTTFKEVGVLLRTKGIDLDHNRFLILQGEVEQISQMKPKAENKNEEGMLEYLEDIIGSSRLKPFIEKLSNQVRSLFSAIILWIIFFSRTVMSSPDMIFATRSTSKKCRILN